MKIQKDNLTIRSAVLEDAEILTHWWNDGAVMAHAGFPKGLGQSLEKTLEQIKENDNHFSQLCMLEIDSIPVGEMSFHLLEDGIAEIGIKICNENCQNRGAGTGFLNMMLMYLFEDGELNEQYPVEKIILNTNLKNERAQHVYEKIGFIRMGVKYHAWKDQLGQWQDSVDYEMTRQCYEAEKGK